jgi:hypothetical protein
MLSEPGAPCQSERAPPVPSGIAWRQGKAHGDQRANGDRRVLIPAGGGVAAAYLHLRTMRLSDFAHDRQAQPVAVDLRPWYPIKPLEHDRALPGRCPVRCRSPEPTRPRRPGAVES